MADSNLLKIDDSFTLNVYDRDDFALNVSESKTTGQLIVLDEFDADLMTEAGNLLSEDEEGSLIIDTDDEGSNKSGDLVDNKKENDDKPKNLQCSMCGFYACLSNKKTYFKHISDHSLNIPLLKCKYCSFQSFYRKHLSLHMTRYCPNRTLKKIACSQCNFHTVKYKCLNRHIKTAHLGEEVKKKTYKCSKCEFRTLEVEMLRKHRQKLHPKKVLMCKICHIKCPTATSLCRHKCRFKLKTKKVTIHQCDLCDFTSKYLRTIRTHREKHLEERLSSISSLKN